MFYQIPMKEPFMIIIVKRFFSIKMKCPKKTSNNLALVSIFGSTLRSDVLKDITTTKDLFIMFTETYSKKSKLKKPKHSNQETIWKKRWENIKALVFQTQISTKYLPFMKIGKILPPTKPLLGANNMILEMPKIDGWKGVCRNKIRRKDKKKRKIISKQSRTL